jgi:hypothetical protein
VGCAESDAVANVLISEPECAPRRDFGNLVVCGALHEPPPTSDCLRYGRDAQVTGRLIMRMLQPLPDPQGGIRLSDPGPPGPVWFVEPDRPVCAVSSSSILAQYEHDIREVYLAGKASAAALGDGSRVVATGRLFHATPHDYAPLILTDVSVEPAKSP